MSRAAPSLEPRPSPEPNARRAEPSPKERVEALAARIRSDARNGSAAYLRDTVVREGGE